MFFGVSASSVSESIAPRRDLTTSSSMAAALPLEVVLAADAGRLNLEVLEGPGLLAFIVPVPVRAAVVPPEPVLVADVPLAAGALELDNLGGTPLGLLIPPPISMSKDSPPPRLILQLIEQIQNLLNESEWNKFSEEQVRAKLMRKIDTQ